MRIIFSGCLLFLLACSPPKQTMQIKQGVYGTVLLTQGNQMPGPGRQANPGQPVIRQVLFYRLTNINQTTANGTLFTGIKTALVATAKSDQNGHYQISLPVGLYSVFTKEENGIYANYFNGEGNINPVEVKTGSLSSKDIMITYKAAF